MLVQLVCRSDKDRVIQDELNKPFRFSNDHEMNFFILVPTLEYYHQVQGQLIIEGLKAEVICLINPSTYRPPIGRIPYALVTPDFTPVCDPIGGDNRIGTLEYYFIPKIS